MDIASKIKRLEAEAVERDKRIKALEAKVLELQADLLPHAFLRDGGEYVDEFETPAPKKRRAPRKK